MSEGGRGSGSTGSADNDSRSGSGSGSDGWRTSLTALATASALAFVTVFFGWLPNPFASGEKDPAGPAPQPAVSSGSPVPEQARVEVVTRGFPPPERIPARFRADTLSGDGTVLATRLALTLRNPGRLKAAVSEFRFTLREVRGLESMAGPAPCLPRTGGITRITADYDIDLTPTKDRHLPATVAVEGDYDLAAGEVERVLFTIGDAPSLSPGLYLVDIALVEGSRRQIVPAGTVAFLGPIAYRAPASFTSELETADDYLRWLHTVARSDRDICDQDLVADASRILSTADDLSPEAKRLRTELDVLRQREDHDR